MHLQRLDRLSAPHHSASNNALRQVLRPLRWQLAFERLARVSTHGLIASSVAVIGLSATVWLTQLDAFWLWAGAAPLVAAVVYGIVRWPSPRETAVAVDRRRGLEERLATAVELAEGRRQSRFVELQLQDALRNSSRAPLRLLELDGRVRNEAILALAAAALAAAVVVLTPRIPRPAIDSALSDGVSSSDVAPAADELAQRALPLDVAEEALATPVAATASAPKPDLAARVQQEQAERSALDTLAQALDTISAGQPVATAIQQGDFNTARDQLQNLADNADQLTEAAKHQLARGLQQAATSTAQSDTALGTREQQAAQALSRSNYTEQRQALSALADQVQRSGSQSVPSDQLERDVGQLQQQQSGATAQNSAGRATSRAAGQAAASKAGAGQASGDPTGAGAQAQGASTSGENGNGAGDQNGAGIGTGTDPNLYSDKPSRLDSSGQQVQVPLKLSNGPGVRPADGTEDQSVPDPSLGGRTISETAQTQQTGQIAPEQNLVPGEQRSVVRGYFR